MRHRLEEMAQGRAADLQRLEDLNNRLYLIEQRLRSSPKGPLAIGDAPRLPVIRIRPDEGKVADEDQLTDEAPARKPSGTTDDPPSLRIVARGDGRSVVENRDVIYSGAALKHEARRPMLRSSGPAADTLAETGDAKSRPSGDALRLVKEKLPLVPVAKLPLAKHSRSSVGMDKSSGRGENVAERARERAPAAEQRAYLAALANHRAGRHQAAARAFRAFLAGHRMSVLAGNALYWMGESYYDLGEYFSALDTFRTLVENYPNGNKAPGGLLKMGYCFLRLRQQQNARTVLAQVVEIFPKSDVARLANAALSKLQ
jgi:tol-pal system protein YbgF